MVTVYFTVTEPGLPPVTTPPGVILAVPVPLTIDHVPPPGEQLNEGVVEPEHTLAAPLFMGATIGVPFTVSSVVDEADPQLLVTVYLTVTEPAVPPVTTPPEVIVAVPVPLSIDQVPPAVALVKAGVDAPAQTPDAPPLIAATVGVPFTASGVFTVVVPQLLVTL